MVNAKKLILTVFVAVVFIGYSFLLRTHLGHLVIKPKSLSTNSSAPTTGSASSGGGNSSGGSSSVNTASKYKDGTYVGDSENAYYGNVQVSVTISNGKITAVKFLQYPNTHSTSVYINQQAMPYLQQEAIQTQNSNVSLISGATFTSQAFVQSLSTALSKAQA